MPNGSSFCVLGSRSSPRYWPVALTDWLIEAAYMAVLLMLTLFKAFKIWKANLYRRGFSLAKTLVQNQSVFILLAVVCATINIYPYYKSVTSLAGMEVVHLLGSQSLLCLLSCRLLINLKESGERQADGGTACPSILGSTIRFAS
ncbi:uncharacterized protein FOMMEDRAFT_150473 [Fomitiporia mediterranea MF3/22]|uniref:uncharacterized protein n=1 Tax=Fomitiporia mediterranea (strain MF3/22) TaxID=694068 RepID=UPI000440966B|nr:uncharacterized protein FOMMEDRAFT_150473 [Fomitiporia mediterranea MF3/22]EJD07884.1 hypothetical protein FOMMEDRAFT_150473 [Fomitiporia mediterranea MF3/22]